MTTMTKFKDSELLEIFTELLTQSNTSPVYEFIEVAFELNFLSHAKYLKETMNLSTGKKKDAKKNKVVLVNKFTKTGDCICAILSRIVHEDADVPDSFELSYEFSDNAIKGADTVVSTTDPEFLSIFFELALSKSVRVTSHPMVSNVLTHGILEAINTYVERCRTEGKDGAVELDGVFSLDVISGETEEDSKAILLPGSLVKTIIKSDDATAIEAEEA